jgi:hypothetical protein
MSTDQQWAPVDGQLEAQALRAKLNAYLRSIDRFHVQGHIDSGLQRTTNHGPQTTDN